MYILVIFIYLLFNIYIIFIIYIDSLVCTHVHTVFAIYLHLHFLGCLQTKTCWSNFIKTTVYIVGKTPTSRVNKVKHSTSGGDDSRNSFSSHVRKLRNGFKTSRGIINVNVPRQTVDRGGGREGRAVELQPGCASESALLQLALVHLVSLLRKDNKRPRRSQSRVVAIRHSSDSGNKVHVMFW